MKKFLSLFALVALGTLSTSCVVAIGNLPDRCEECGQKICAECGQNEACEDCEEVVEVKETWR
ncbi:MAG: hypothetical protein O3A20_07365 [Planctomycetota bacterium]|nr:hypothetical protein [Planctomycetota bacterium]